MEDKFACLLKRLWSAGINLCKSVQSVGEKIIICGRHKLSSVGDKKIIRGRHKLLSVGKELFVIDLI